VLDEPQVKLLNTGVFQDYVLKETEYGTVELCGGFVSDDTTPPRKLYGVTLYLLRPDTSRREAEEAGFISGVGLTIESALSQIGYTLYGLKSLLEGEREYLEDLAVAEGAFAARVLGQEEGAQALETLGTRSRHLDFLKLWLYCDQDVFWNENEIKRYIDTLVYQFADPDNPDRGDARNRVLGRVRLGGHEHYRGYYLENFILHLDAAYQAFQALVNRETFVQVFANQGDI
jgi:hypothetical protein